jgi:hypothetical protein
MVDLETQAETDLTWSLSSLTEFTVSLPSKRSQWLRRLIQAVKIKDACDEALSAKSATLTVYYMQEYAVAIDRRDIEHYVKTDKEYQACVSQLNDAKRQVYLCEKVLSSLEKASFDVGNVVKYEIFKAGG